MRARRPETPPQMAARYTADVLNALLEIARSPTAAPSLRVRASRLLLHSRTLTDIATQAIAEGGRFEVVYRPAERRQSTARVRREPRAPCTRTPRSGARA